MEASLAERHVLMSPHGFEGTPSQTYLANDLILFPTEM